jgi:hypothetical protein
MGGRAASPGTEFPTDHSPNQERVVRTLAEAVKGLEIVRPSKGPGRGNVAAA